MRKILLAAGVAVALLCSGFGTNTANADHGLYGAGYGGYAAPGCHADHYHSGYAPRYSGYGGGYGYGRVSHYSSTVVPVYRGGVYQSYSFGGSPFVQPGFGPVGNPYGVPQYGVGYGSGLYGSGFPRLGLS